MTDKEINRALRALLCYRYNAAPRTMIQYANGNAERLMNEAFTLADIGLNSLGCLSLKDNIDKEFGITLDSRIFPDTKISEITNAIKAELQTNG